MSPSSLIKRLIKKIIYLTPGNGFKQFHHFPFDTLKPMPSSANSLLSDVLTSINSKNMQNYIRVSDGVLLGFYRDGRLIPHDTDLDFDVFDCDQSIIEGLAQKYGWILGRQVSYAKKIQQLTYYDEDENIIDFVFWYPDGQFMKNFSEKGYIRVQPRSFFDSYTVYKVSDIELIIPEEIESWLVYRYGKSWKIPLSSKGDWKEECTDLIKL